MDTKKRSALITSLARREQGSAGVIVMTKSVNRLTYVIASQTLKGQIGGQPFEMKAVSGGGRGSIVTGTAQHSQASFDPKKATTGSEANQRGGALPPGLWWIYPPKWKDKHKHPSLGAWVAFVRPTGNQAKFYSKRTYDKDTGFFVHGSGTRGSNGCLVIEPDARRRLLQAVEDAGGVALEVVLSETKYSPQDLLRYALREGWRGA
jgi:hypothetical protein